MNATTTLKTFAGQELEELLESVFNSEGAKRARRASRAPVSDEKFCAAHMSLKSVLQPRTCEHCDAGRKPLGHGEKL